MPWTKVIRLITENDLEPAAKARAGIKSQPPDQPKFKRILNIYWDAETKDIVVVIEE